MIRESQQIFEIQYNESKKKKLINLLKMKGKNDINKTLSFTKYTFCF